AAEAAAEAATAPAPSPTDGGSFVGSAAVPPAAAPPANAPSAAVAGSAAVNAPSAAVAGSAAVNAPSAAVAGSAAQQAAPADGVLPQRVPAVPDVPDVPLRPNDPLLDPAAVAVADGTELSRIATYLRDDTGTEPEDRPDGFDLNAVLTAVRGVVGVRDATLRYRSGVGHTLRI